MRHDLGMKSRVHPKYKTKYRVSNWAEYDRALVQRGNITLWISADAIASWKPAPTGRRGAQMKFSDHAIEAALTLRPAAFQDILELDCCKCNARNLWSKFDSSAIREVDASRSTWSLKTAATVEEIRDSL